MGPKSLDYVPYDRQASSISTASSDSFYPSAADDAKAAKGSAGSAAWKTAPSAASVRSFFVSALLFYVGIFHTKLFVPNHDAAFSREHPMFLTKAGDVLLNFELNHALVYPASVPCKCELSDVTFPTFCY